MPGGRGLSLLSRGVRREPDVLEIDLEVARVQREVPHVAPGAAELVAEEGQYERSLVARHLLERRIRPAPALAVQRLAGLLQQVNGLGMRGRPAALVEAFLRMVELHEDGVGGGTRRVEADVR